LRRADLDVAWKRVARATSPGIEIATSWHVVCTIDANGASSCEDHEQKEFVMKRFGSLSSAVIGCFALAGVASAETVSGDPSQMGHPHAMGQTAPAAAGFAGSHQMTGTVTEIDKSSGEVKLEAEGGKMLDLHFPPSALSGVDKGDRLTVQLAFREAGSTTSTGSGGPAGAGMGAESPRR
jgi:hypothetical protein